MNNTKNIEEMINSSDIDSRYLALSMIRSGNTGLSDKQSKILVKKLPVIERIKNLEDICYELNTTLDEVLLFKSPKTKLERYLNSCVLIPKIAKVYNENWIVNFNDSNQKKYYIYANKVGSGWSLAVVGHWTTDALGPSGFYFETSEKATDAKNKFGQTFIDWIDYSE